MHTVNVPKMKQMVKYIGIDQREALMFWGPPGVGKSEGIRQAAEEYGALHVDIRLSQYDSVDLRGIPAPVAETGLTTWFAPATLPFKGNVNFDPSQLTFLMLDEINSATPAVAAVAYQLVNEKRVGEHELHDNVVVIAAGNREGDRGVTNRMPTPLSNRFTHAEVVADVDATIEHFQARGLPAIGAAFLKFRHPLLNTFDPAKADKAFATPRTWEKALRYFASGMPEDIKDAGIAGAVGDGPAAEFKAFQDVWTKMTPIKTIIADPEKVPVPKEAAMNYALSVAISGALDKKTVTPLYRFLERMGKSEAAGPEFITLAWQLATKRDRDLFTTPEFVKFAKEYKAIFS